MKYLIMFGLDSINIIFALKIPGKGFDNMRRFLKYIPSYLMLLAWLIIVAHLIIPHDHHLSESFADQNESCPFSKSKTDHHPFFPVHCHAFNNILSEKAIKFVLANNLGRIAEIIPDMSDRADLSLQASKIRYCLFKDPLVDSPHFSFSLLRAPPRSV